MFLRFALVLLAACSMRRAPAHPTERALFRDLERQVTIAAATGWGIDRTRVEGMLETTLDSTCRVHPLARRALARWLDDQIAEHGGDVELAWRERGKNLSKVDDLLVLTRVRLVLRRAEESAHECPFWIEPEDTYRGRQISEHRFQVSLGGGGKAIAIQQGKDADVSAGGAGRLLLGRMLGNGDGVYVGLEIGGSAGFPKDAMGNRGNLEIAADVSRRWSIARRSSTRTSSSRAAGSAAPPSATGTSTITASTSAPRSARARCGRASCFRARRSGSLTSASGAMRTSPCSRSGHV